MTPLILAVNPGSTSTKAALFRGEELLKEINCPHADEEIKACGGLSGQIDLRKDSLKSLLHEIGNEKLDVVIGRGGLMKPLAGGVYRVNKTMLEDLVSCRYGIHASNLGASLAAELAARYGVENCPAFIADPVVVDEMIPEARISGIKGMERRSIFHALNQKSTGRAAAASMGKAYEDVNLIIAHMGGGISVGAHRKGRVIDVNNALDGEGPFSPERSGTVPAGQLLDLVEKGVPVAEIRRLLTGYGGLASLNGNKDFRILEEDHKKGIKESSTIHKALVLQISQEICSHGATLEGHIDGIVLTGGLANSSLLVEDIIRRIGFLGKVIVIPGEREMQSLAESAYAALLGKREIREYS
ncbi:MULTISPECIES: butyrate kinase [unclassified Oceanispirochaeta]|uniref:butyrate kinase n=1 Tax=unclassified Oceanispirochaeta TaxID=2635722 RepID=UPI000E08FF07|nr:MULTISPECIES: butyrate kinase [unclassified Oceanispirochaeta]MBF9016603.1 butyrate kinase [Oceanispirochaeta sp. M2]NPD73066.1 butyrate kinase [Oceanispirochaeta sp. M1]RDG31411.1 butyrate kinase [Oceanispirochaeta sp. M1]